MRDGPWKLLHDRDAMYLFDLGKDLGEQHDLSAQFPERVKTMSENFQAWAKDVGVSEKVAKEDNETQHTRWL
jgi:arylsulfatase